MNYNIKNPETRAVIAIRKVKLKSGASAEAFEKWAAKLANDEYGKVPGVKYYVAKGERGGRNRKLYMWWNSIRSKPGIFTILRRHP